MFRAKPIACKLTAQRYDEHCQQLHQRRLQTIKCSVDNKPPRRHDHVYRNLKREVLLEERFSQIEHENRLLLKKVSGIMAKASVDNVNTSSKFAHSLNAGVRMQERERICRENEAMLKRLQEKPPHYSHAQWDTERKQAEKLLSSICEFPPIFVKKPRHPDRLPRIDSAQERHLRRRLVESHDGDKLMLPKATLVPIRPGRESAPASARHRTSSRSPRQSGITHAEHAVTTERSALPSAHATATGEQ